MIKRIWGLRYSDVNSDGYIYRRTFITNPFQKAEKWYAGLNEKFLNDCLNKKVHKLILVVGQREIIVSPPTKKEIKKMEKDKMFEDKPSMFQGSPDLRIYHFPIYSYLTK